MEKEMKLFGNRVYGEEVSDYGLKNGYLDYYTLSKIVGDMVLNNSIYEETFEDWDIIAGNPYDEDDESYDIYQYYIISGSGYEFLSEFTNEIVFYNEKLDMYLRGITHFGTSWDYVLTDIKLVK